MTDKQTKQAILGFTEFFKGITGNQNLEIPSEIAEKYGIQAQADGKYISRLSEADGILEEIENICFDNEYILDRLSLARNIIQDKDEAFRQLSSKAIPSAEPKWIPVSERLPEFRKEVLTCSNGGFIEIQSLEDSYDGYWENQKGDWTDLEEIIAWMPLPKPYREEGVEK